MPKIDKRVSLNEENVKWFYETFPNGSLSEMCNLLLSELRDCIEFELKSKITETAESVKDMIL